MENLDVQEQIDRLLHDMENAQSGAAFADTMIKQQPGNGQHEQAKVELQAKADTLWAEATKLWKQAGVHHVECCPEGELCALCGSSLEPDTNYDRLLRQMLITTPCSVCNQTGFFKYKGPTYTA